MNHIATSKPFRLTLKGNAELYHGERVIKLRKKGLAILYYLALEGPTRREVLADLLWDHFEALGNLRVELHRLRREFSPLDYITFRPGEDPLKLPDFIALDSSGAGEILSGLDNLSEPFGGWLAAQRSRLAGSGSKSAERKQLIAEVGRRVRLPYLIILEGPIGHDSVSFARSLARSLSLPYIEGAKKGKRAVRAMRLPYPEGALPRMLNDEESVWVVERPTYGEDPKLILELKSAWPVERLHYLKLPPLTWSEAKAAPLSELPFVKAAEIYLASGGNPGYIREVLAMTPHGREDDRGDLPTYLNGAPQEDWPTLSPMRMRALIQLNTRFLSLEARIALERLSVHPGPLGDGLLEVFEAKPHLEEFERRGWLSFHGAWGFADEAARRLIYAGLQSGRRQRYHQSAAQQLALEQQRVAEAYHLARVGQQVDWGELAACVPGWAQRSLFEARRVADAPTSPERRVKEAGTPPTSTRFGLGAELALLENRSFGGGVSVADEANVTWVREPLGGEPSGVEWELPGEPCLLHLKGCAYMENPLGVGLTGTALPLSLELIGAHAPKLLFAEAPHATWLNADTRLLDSRSIPEDTAALLLPLRTHFDYWVYLPKAWGVRVQSEAEAGVLELQAAAYRPLALEHAPENRVTEAYDLRRVPAEG